MKREPGERREPQPEGSAQGKLRKGRKGSLKNLKKNKKNAWQIKQPVIQYNHKEKKKRG